MLRCLKSPESNYMFNSLFGLTTKNTSKFPITGSLWDKSIYDWWIPLTNGQ